METSLPTPMTGRVYINLPEGTWNKIFFWGDFSSEKWWFHQQRWGGHRISKMGTQATNMQDSPANADLIVEPTKNEGLEFGVQKSKQGKQANHRVLGGTIFFLLTLWEDWGLGWFQEPPCKFDGGGTCGVLETSLLSSHRVYQKRTITGWKWQLLSETAPKDP